MDKFLKNGVFSWFTDFFKTYGLSATLILGGCVLGILNIGQLFGYELNSIILFIYIGICYMIFHVPTLWATVYGFLNLVLNSIKAFLFGKKQ